MTQSGLRRRDPETLSTAFWGGRQRCYGLCDFLPPPHHEAQAAKGDGEEGKGRGLGDGVYGSRNQVGEFDLEIV